MLRILKASPALALPWACTPPADPTRARDTSSPTIDSGLPGQDTSPPSDSSDSETGDTAPPSDTASPDTGAADSGGEDTASTEPATQDTGATDTGTFPTELVADFSLEDLNPTSTRYGQPVSPRDYLEQVSGWYFAHAT